MFIVLTSVFVGFIGASVIMASSFGLLQIAYLFGQENNIWFILLDNISSICSLALYFLFQLSGINLMYKDIVYNTRTIVHYINRWENHEKQN
ncbi:hypothetical protein [Methanimicrococcus hacksteinii]|uniref:hypothetical protein n=1 Tax=Methanimicrococcus hacksteinii TaxID=3028293 RepID=UPI00298EE4FF|nr:hypothetical protein [Methanimicrococcus sp. At1]